MVNACSSVDRKADPVADHIADADAKVRTPWLGCNWSLNVRIG